MDYHIKTQEWEPILCFLQHYPGLHTRNDKGLRCFIEGVWYVLRTGCQWRLLPPHYAYWHALHKRFKNWADRGLWQKLFSAVQKDPDLEHVMIDATIVRAHACSAGREKTRVYRKLWGAARVVLQPKFMPW